MLAVTVDPDGAVTSAVVRRGLGLALDERAIEAVKQWRYNSGGREAYEAVEVDFTLDLPTRWELQGAAFMRSEGRGQRIVHTSLTQYQSPDPAACSTDPAEAVVTFQINDDGTTAGVNSAGPIDSAVTGAAIHAVKTWRFQPIPGPGAGSTSGRVFLQCRPAPVVSTGAREIPLGRGVSQPHVVFKVEPEYTEEARQAKYQGTVMLSVVVTASGRPAAIRVVKPLGLGLDEEAALAVQQWRFAPGLKGEQPVNVRATIEINFKLL
jgi:TonB family protein